MDGEQAQVDLIDVSAEDDNLISSPSMKGATFDFVESPATVARIPCTTNSPESVAEGQESKGQSMLKMDDLHGQEEKESNVASSAIAVEQPPLCQEEKQSNTTSSTTELEQPPLCEEVVPPTRKRRAGQYNMRKSLAWDKAFFTDEGVLNPTELSLLNKTYKKSNELSLPGIEEEESIRSSLDSNGSINGDDFTLQVLEEKLFTKPFTSNDRVDVDKSQYVTSFETLPVQSQLPPPSNAKLLAAGKKHMATKVAKSPEKKASHASQDSLTLRKSNNKGTEELQRTSQPKDASGKNCPPAHPVLARKASTGHKRMKYTHGSAVQANESRASHKSSPSKTKGTCSAIGKSPSPSYGRSISPNSSISVHFDSYTAFEVPKDVALGKTSLSSNRIPPKTSCLQPFDGISELDSSKISNDMSISNSKSVVTSHSSHEQSIPTIDPGMPTDSAFSQCAKQNKGSGKAKTMGLPVKSDSATTACSKMTFNSKDPQNNSGIVRPIPVTAKPSGLRLPSPKLGFFDTDKVMRPPLQKRSSSTRMLPPKSIPRGPSDTTQGSRLRPSGVLNNPYPSYKGAVPSNNSMVTPLRPESRLVSPVASTPSPYPSHKGAVATSISMASNLRPESALESPVALTLTPLQPQLKANLESSGLLSLARQKFGYSLKAQQASSDQRCTQNQVSSDACNAVETLIAGHNESKLQSSFPQVNAHNQKGIFGVMGEEQSHICILQQNCNVQDMPEMDSKQINLNPSLTETSSAVDTGEVLNMQDINHLKPHSHDIVAVVGDATTDLISEPLECEQLLSSTHEDVTKVSEESKFKGTDKELNSSAKPLAVNSKLLNSADQGISQEHLKGQKSSTIGTEQLASICIPAPVLDDIAEKENIMLDGQEGHVIDSHLCISSRRKSVDDLNVQVQNVKNLSDFYPFADEGIGALEGVNSRTNSTNDLNVKEQNTKNPSDAYPFSEEWLSALENIGEEWLQMKRGPVQNSPPDKIVPEPGPWSPVRRHSQQLGPFDCTKYTNVAGNGDGNQDE